MVKANVDRILDVLRQKKSTSISDLSKSLNLKKEDIQKSAEYLEQDGIIKIEHKWPQVVLTLTKDSSNLTQNQSQPLPLPPLNEPHQTTGFQPQKPMTPSFQNQKIQEAPINQNFLKQEQPINKLQQPVNPQNTQPQLKIEPESQFQSQKPVLFQPNKQFIPPLDENLLQSPNSQPTLNPLTQEQQPQLFQPNQNKEINPVFSTPVSKNKNLPPPPIPKKKSFQTSSINYAEQPISEILKIEQDNTRIEKPIPEDFGSSNSEDDPLNPEKPHFNLEVPSPGDEEIKYFNEPTPLFSNTTEFSTRTIEVPSNGNDMEKIEFLLDKLRTKLNNHDYKEINDFYRKIHSIYTESGNISPNERYLISQKINDMFERIKNLYIIEEI